jgi:thiol-disulfide isomerase/thioredoxin
MAMARWGAALASAGLLLLGCLAPASAQTGDKFSPAYKSRPEDVDAVLKYRPRLDGIDYSRPTPDEQKACTMKLILGERQGSTGWLLLDPQGRPLRRFLDTNADQQIDVWSYYKDGVEVFREIDSKMVKGAEKADQFRWLNSAGSKWGVLGASGKFESWKMISAEEAVQEAYQAIATRDLARLKALMITDAEIAALKLPEAQAAKIRANQAKMADKLRELNEKAPGLTATATLKSVESAVPHCLPASSGVGPAQDVLMYADRAILYETADKKHEWVHTGVIIQVGQAWRLTDVPGLSDVTPTPPVPAEGNGKLKKLMDDLMALDKNQPASGGAPGPNKAVAEYNSKRVALLEQVYAETPEAKEKETWMRQILDNLCTGHQASTDSAMLTRLTQFRDQISKAAPSSPMAGYAHYREMWARFALDLAGLGKKDGIKVQAEWHEELIKFVQAYPKAEDAPDALWQLAINAEYGGKEKQDEAKKYYSLIADGFADHPLAPKAKGAVTRLGLNGQPMGLQAPTIAGAPFDLARNMDKKLVLVYFWASNCKVCVGDFAVLKQLQKQYGDKGFEIVTVNLDEQVTAAQTYLAANPLPGTHLFLATEQGRGLESPLAVQYGIVGLPTIILVGKDGRVIDRSVQMPELEEAIRKGL